MLGSLLAGKGAEGVMGVMLPLCPGFGAEGQAAVGEVMPLLCPWIFLRLWEPGPNRTPLPLPLSCSPKLPLPAFSISCQGTPWGRVTVDKTHHAVVGRLTSPSGPIDEWTPMAHLCGPFMTHKWHMTWWLKVAALKLDCGMFRTVSGRSASSGRRTSGLEIQHGRNLICIWYSRKYTLQS